jgi:hypothetical protein
MSQRLKGRRVNAPYLISYPMQLQLHMWQHDSGCGAEEGWEESERPGGSPWCVLQLVFGLLWSIEGRQLGTVAF